METTTWTIKVAAPAATLTLGEAAENYLMEKQVGGLAENSLISYRRILADLTGFLEGITAESLSPALLKRYFAAIFEREYKRSTIQLYHAVISDFCRWLSETGATASNPYRGIRRPKTRRRLPRILSVADERRLLLACRRDFNGVRLRAIIMTFLGTGIRVSELAGLRPDRLDFDRGMLRVIGKGDMERAVPISPALKGVLQNWLVTREHFLKERAAVSDYLFVNARGNCPHRSTIERQLKNLCSRAGVSPISPHVLRASFATRQAEEGKSPWEIKNWLGHADISTTQIYVNVSAVHVRENFGEPLRLFTS